MKIFVFILAVLGLTPVYSAGVQEYLVNEQELDLTYIDDIMISYRSEDVTLFKSDSALLVIKEYMSEDNRDYYARITNSGNKLNIEAGRRPVSVLFNHFSAHIEIYIPVTSKNISIKTSSGRIQGDDEYTASSISVESSSGSISLNRLMAGTVNLRASSGTVRCSEVNGNTTARTSSGSIILGSVKGGLSAEASSGDIRCKEVNGNAAANTTSGSINLGSVKGNVSAEASSGGIELDLVGGTLDAKASSGSIHCTIAETAGDISITNSSGGVTLNVPRNLAFNFSSRRTSGNLRTPFQDRLFSPVSDNNIAQGVINGDNAGGRTLSNINIRTSSGSIRVNWAD